MRNSSYILIQILLNFTGVIVMVSRYAGVFDLSLKLFCAFLFIYLFIFVHKVAIVRAFLL